MAPKAFPSEESSHESSLSSCLPHMNGGLELSSSSHSIAKPKSRPKKAPIIRVVHVFAPKLINADVTNFRTLVQELTGNHPSQAEEVEQETSHGHSEQKETTLAATALRHLQFEEDYEDPFVQLQYGISQVELASNHAGFATSNSHFSANQAGLAAIDERDGYVPAVNQGELARSDGSIGYFPCANYDYDDAYSYDSPSSLDTSSTRGDSHTSYGRGNNACVFSDELDLMGAFNSSCPLINLVDDQHQPQVFMNALDTKLEFSLINPTW